MSFQTNLQNQKQKDNALKNLISSLGNDKINTNFSTAKKLFPPENDQKLKSKLKMLSTNLDSEFPIQKVPISIFPKKFKSANLASLISDMEIFNRLTDRIASDSSFLKESLIAVAEKDSFTRRLLEVLDEYEKERHFLVTRDMAFGINRSDFLFDKTAEQFKQVEMNTISCAFFALSEELFKKQKKFIESNFELGRNISYPENDSCGNLIEAIAIAHKTVLEAKPQKLESIAVMVINEKETKMVDHDLVVEALYKTYDVKMVKLTLKEVLEKCKRDEKSKDLIYLEKYFISMVYYRSGYSPDDYPSEADWKARILIETSDCLKAPSVAYQLAGTKKTQQILTKKEILERFLTKTESNKIRKYFTEIYGLGKNDENVNSSIRNALNSPDNWLLKPQREGGGHVISGEEMTTLLKSQKNLSEFVLMRKIDTVPNWSLFSKNEQLKLLPSVNELGAFGVYLKNGDEILNRFSGWLLRSKPDGAVEGGVMHGEGFLDTFCIDRTM